MSSRRPPGSTRTPPQKSPNDSSRSTAAVTEPVAPQTLPIAGLVAVVAAILYAPTVAPTIGYVDSGELTAAAATLGIAHPTGYPTMTMLGWLVTRVIPGEPARVLNLFSMILTAIGAGVACLLLARLVAGLGPARRERSASPLASTLLTALSALSLAFTRPWWSQATGFEVYSLHLVLMPAALLLAVSAMEREASRVLGRAAAFAFGLSFSNHLTTLLVLPALAVWALIRGAWTRRSIGVLLRLAPFFVAGLLPYVYVLLRAGQDPPLNWGDPSDLGRFFAHVSGAQYRGWMFQGDVFGAQTGYFLSGVSRDWGYLGLAIAAVGVVALMRRPATLAFGLLLIAASVLYAGNFRIHEILPYYLTATLGIGVFYAAGLGLLRRIGTAFALFAAVATLGLGAWMNFRVLDASRNTLAHDFARDVLSVTDSNAVVFSVEWSLWISAAMYVQHVEGVRRDVAVIQTNTLEAPWRLEQLARREPALIGPARTQVDRYVALTRRIDRREPVPPDTVFAALQAMLQTVVARALPHRPMYVTPDLVGSLGPQFAYVPTGLVFRVMPEPVDLPIHLPEDPPRLVPGADDFYSISVYGMRARAAEARARHEWDRGRQQQAAEMIRYAQALDPHLLVERLPREPLDGGAIARGELDYFSHLRTIRIPVSGSGSSPNPR